VLGLASALAGSILRVLLETEEVSGERALSHGTLGAGRYLRLIFADSGSGMDEANPGAHFRGVFHDQGGGPLKADLFPVKEVRCRKSRSFAPPLKQRASRTRH